MKKSFDIDDSGRYMPIKPFVVTKAKNGVITHVNGKTGIEIERECLKSGGAQDFLEFAQEHGLRISKTIQKEMLKETEQKYGKEAREKMKEAIQNIVINNEKIKVD
jgi:endonuclease YncB( thermonuclease family)